MSAQTYAHDAPFNDANISGGIQVSGQEVDEERDVANGTN